MLIVLSAAAISCAKTPGSSTPAEISDGITMNIEPVGYKTVPEQITLKVTNNTKTLAQFGAQYTIEYFNTASGSWERFGPPENTVIIAIMYMLQPGISQDYRISLYPDRLEYKPGRYRILKRISVDNADNEYYAPFMIE